MILPLPPAAVRRLFVACLLLACASARAVTVEEIPRPAGWVVDQTGTLPAGTVAELNRLGDEVNAKTGGELAVVVIGTTNGADPREFAIRLFNHWGIGAPGQDNGLLVFAALDDRAVEIILGDGLDDDARNRASEEIMQGVMVPRFREGDPAGAVLQGTTACALRILGAPPTVGTEPPISPLPLASPAPAEVPVSPEAPFSAKRSRALMVPLGFGFLLLLAGGAALAGGIWLLVRPRLCPKCQTKMVLLSEAEDDAHLQPSQKTEERIGSVNYNIWHCPGCGEIRKTRWGRFFSGYSDCLGCSAKTLASSSRTLTEATYDFGGTVQVIESCMNCSYSRSYTHSTPQLQRPTEYESPATSSSFSSSTSFSSDSGSSSSSSDGGHSSGGGASGRW